MLFVVYVFGATVFTTVHCLLQIMFWDMKLRCLQGIIPSLGGYVYAMKVSPFDSGRYCIVSVRLVPIQSVVFKKSQFMIFFLLSSICTCTKTYFSVLHCYLKNVMPVNSIHKCFLLFSLSVSPYNLIWEFF